MVQLSCPYMNTGKTTALTRQTSVNNIMPLLFNMLSRFVIAFLLRRKHLLISWLPSLSAVILEPPRKSLSLFPLFPHLFAMKWWDPISKCWDLSQLFHSLLTKLQTMVSPRDLVFSSLVCLSIHSSLEECNPHFTWGLNFTLSFPL